MDKYKSLDIVKFICAIFVIAGHTQALIDINNIANIFLCNVLVRIVVPVFFMSSGFLFFKKINNTVDKKKYYIKYIKKLLLLYIIWTLVFIYWDLPISALFQGNSIEIIFCYLWKIIFIGSSFYLWFIPALIFSISLLYFSIVTNKENFLLVISIIFYLIGLIGESYFGFIKDTNVESVFRKYFYYFSTTRNGLFLGWLLLFIGAKHGKILFKIKYSGILSIVFFLLLTLESYILHKLNIPKDYNFYIFLIPFSYYFFNWVIFINVKDTINTGILRKISINIYFSHGIFLILIPKIFSKFNWPYNSFIFFLSSSITSIIFSFILYRYSHKLKLLIKNWA